MKVALKFFILDFFIVINILYYDAFYIEDSPNLFYVLFRNWDCFKDLN
jgi:hypothetical protein